MIHQNGFGKNSIKEDTSVPAWQQMVSNLLADHETITRLIRTVMTPIAETGDEASVNLLTERMNEHEKTAWMLHNTVE